MLVNVREYITKRSDELLTRLVLSATSEVIMRLIEGRYKDTGEVNMVLTLDGMEVDVEEFCKNLQSNIHRRVEEAAYEIVDQRCSTIWDHLNEVIEEEKQRLSARLRKMVHGKREPDGSELPEGEGGATDSI